MNIKKITFNYQTGERKNNFPFSLISLSLNSRNEWQMRYATARDNVQNAKIEIQFGSQTGYTL